MKALAIFLALAFATLTKPAMAQSEADGSWKNIKRNTAVMIFSGVGGGVLGLSTLSFYGKPEEHTGNITTGALLGVLGGGLYVLLKKPKPAEPLPWSLDLGPAGTKVGWRWQF